MMNVETTFGSPPPDIETMVKEVYGAAAEGALERELFDRVNFSLIESDAAGQGSLAHTAFYTDALKRLTEAIQLDPQNPDNHLMMGVAYGQLRYSEEAIEACERAIELFNGADNPHQRTKLSIAYYLRGYSYGSLARQQRGEEARRYLHKAEASFKEAINQVGDYAKAYFYLGTVYRDLERWQEAEEAYKKAIQINPDDSKHYSDLGLLYEVLGRLEEALEAFRHAVRVNPHNPIALYNLGKTYLDAGHWSEARTILEQAIAIAPDYVIPYSGLAGAYYHLCDLERAEALLRKAIELDPEDAPAYTNLGAVLSKRGRLEEAERAFEEALALEPENSIIQHNLRLLREKYQASAKPTHPLSKLRSFATDMGVTDLAARHDYYAHGRREDNVDTSN
jgi:tetratricopeptide (TPR) repeat protein